MRSSAARTSGSVRTALAHVAGRTPSSPRHDGGHRRPHLALDPAPAGVVAAEAAAGRLTMRDRVVGAQAHVARAERHDEILAQRALAVADGLVDDVAHAGVALDAGRERRVDLLAAGGEPHVGHEVGEHDLLDAGLAERRQHLLDVAQEHPVRAR